MKNEKRNQPCKKRIHWLARGVEVGWKSWKSQGTHSSWSQDEVKMKSRWSHEDGKTNEVAFNCGHLKKDLLFLLFRSKERSIQATPNENDVIGGWQILSSSSSCSSRELTCRQQGQGDKHNPRFVGMNWHETVGGVEAVEITVILKRRKGKGNCRKQWQKERNPSSNKKKERKSEEIFTRQVKMGETKAKSTWWGFWINDDRSNTSGITPGKEPSKGKVGNRQGRARQIMDWIGI